MPQTENINWRFTKDAILNQRSIVFLGPGLTTNYGQSGREAQFFKELAQKNPGDILSYHSEDGFLIFNNETAKLLYSSEIRPFYEHDFGKENEALQKLAEIPFHLYISLTPDLSLNHIFKTRNFAFQHQYYKPKLKQNISQPPEKEKPLVYNLLGCVKDDESLITSHYDLFNFVQSIYADKNLPEALTSVFSQQQTKNIIFLGLDFDKWYFQLLLHLLKVNFDPCVRYAAQQKDSLNPRKTLYESHFKINFVSQDLVGFVDSLHQQFDPGELRKPAEGNDQSLRKYRKGNIIKFLAKAFNANAFETFCLINYEDVHDNFVDGMPQAARLNLLMDFVARQEGYAELLDLGREENPVQYAKFEPYYDED